MKLLVVTPLWPYRSHSIRAANIVIYEMLHALATRNDVSVGLLVVGTEEISRIGDVEQVGIDGLRHVGVDVLPPLVLPKVHRRRARLNRLFLQQIEDRYPQCLDWELIADRVSKWNAEAILVPWSEWLTHACSKVPVLKFAYYGNPDPKGARTQLSLRFRNGEIGAIRRLFETMRINTFEQLHLEVMRRYELLGNVALNDAEYYGRNGHPNAFYIQNIWMRSPISTTRRVSPKDRPIRIIGSIGKVGGTANTLGLEYLGREVMPALKVVFNERPFEVHILGSGSPHPIAAKALNQPNVIWRGFVDNIDEEIRDCDIFLCTNNATEYKVGHTRYLHAWSLAAPVVAHRDASLSMPEIVHEKNALLGNSAHEIAEHVRRAVDDAGQRCRIAEQGLRTFEEHFTADKVAATILKKLQGAAA